jgi:hypothetical protein
MPELQTYQMRGIVPKKATYVRLVATGEMHNGIEVVEPQDVTLDVESFKSAWAKLQANHTEAIEKLRQRVSQLECGRNAVLEEVAVQLDIMPGDSAASFAAFVRGLKE